MPRVTRKSILWALVALSFLGVVVLAVVVSEATAWFIVVVAAFTVFVIALAPWLLGN